MVREKASEGLVVVTGVGPVAKDLADVAVGSLLALAAVVCGVWWRVWHLHLCGTVLGVVEVKAVADVAEQPRRGLLLDRLLVKTAKKTKTDCGVTLKLKSEMNFRHASHFHFVMLHIFVILEKV